MFYRVLRRICTKMAQYNHTYEIFVYNLYQKLSGTCFTGCTLPRKSAVRRSIGSTFPKLNPQLLVVLPGARRATVYDPLMYTSLNKFISHLCTGNKCLWFVRMLENLGVYQKLKNWVDWRYFTRLVNEECVDAIPLYVSLSNRMINSEYHDLQIPQG